MTFTLIYTGNNTVVAQLVNGAIIDVSMYPNLNFNIRVDTINSSVKSVLFLQSNQVEVSKPWAYCGNVGELYNTCSDFNKEGTFNVTVRLYSDANPQSMVVSVESILFTLVGKSSSTPPVEKFPILINAGGPTVIDSENRTWIADSYFVGGNTYSNSQIDLINTGNDIIYQSERYGNFIYEIPIPIASYSVVLHFAEI
jgi:Malectin domain